MHKLRTEEEIVASWRGGVEKPMVSICCLTYNHERFIEDAIRGFLIQETDFPFEIVIHDDASTDKTQEIIRNFCILYPMLIKPIFQAVNQYSRGINPGIEFLLPAATGKYVALCEGDDYWTDKGKIKKQALYLESNPGYSMSSHAVKFVFEGVTEKHNNYQARPVIDACFEDIIGNGLFIALNSIVFRRNLLDWPRWLDSLPGGHKALIYLITSKGMNHHFMEEMGVKRRNPGGITVRDKKQRRASYHQRNIFLLEQLKEYLGHTKDAAINSRLRGLYFRRSIKNFKSLKIVGAVGDLIQSLKLLDWNRKI